MPPNGHHAPTTNGPITQHTNNNGDNESDLSSQSSLSEEPDEPSLYHKTENDDMKFLIADNLDMLSQSRKSASTGKSKLKIFGDLLAQWVASWEKNEKQGLLVYVLVNGRGKYKDRKLELDSLEPTDQRVTRFVEQHCKEGGICLYLAKMTTVHRGTEVEPQMTLNLHETSEINGGLLTNRQIRLERGSLIQKDVFQHNKDPDSNGTSPDEASKTRQFDDWVLLMMPEGHRLKFLMDNANVSELHTWILRQSSMISPTPVEDDSKESDQKVRHALAAVCKSQLRNIQFGHKAFETKQPELLEAVVRAALKLQDTALLQNAIILSPRDLSLGVWNDIGHQLDLGRFSHYQNGLDRALVQIDSFQDRYIVLDSIRSGFESKEEPQKDSYILEVWVNNKLEEALSEIDRVEENDASLLIKVGKNYGKDFMISKVFPFAREHASCQPFAIQFALLLYDEGAAKMLETEVVRMGVHDVLSTAIPLIKIRATTDTRKRPIPRSAPAADLNTEHDAHPHLQPDRWSVTADRLIDVLNCCINLDLHDEEWHFLRQMWIEASIADAQSLQHIFLPFIKRLRHTMFDHDIPPNKDNYQWLFQQTISLFIIRYIGKEPFNPLNSTLPRMGCGKQKRYCRGCTDLDDFLMHPDIRSVDIVGTGDIRAHVMSHLNYGDVYSPTHVGYLEAKTLYSEIDMANPNARHTLRVTKWFTQPTSPDHAAWTERVYAANDMIQDIARDEEWKLLLGERYDECMGLKAVKL